MDTKKEKWLPIYGCKGYSVSNLGRIKKSGFMTRYDNGDVEYGDEVIIPVRVSPSGVSVTIKSRPYLVHRLVAKAFVDPENDRDYVHFKDGDRTNCAADNLEFVSVSETLKDAIARGARSKPAEYTGIRIQCVETGEICRSIKAVMERVHRSRSYVTKHIRSNMPIDEKHYIFIRKQK